MAMKFRLTALVALLATILLLSQAASAQDLYVSNRPFKDHVTLGGQMYVPLQGLLKALKADWTVEGQVVTVQDGTGVGEAITGEMITLRRGSKITEVKGIARDDGTWVPLRDVGKALGIKVLYNEDLDIVDVIAAREVTEADRQATEEVAAAREAREKATQEAWEKRREKIQADRKAKEEAEKAAAEAAGEGAAPEGGGEGTFPEEMAKDEKAPAKDEKAPAKDEKAPAKGEKEPAKDEKAPAAEEKAPAKDEKAPAKEEAPKPEPEAKLIVIRPNAVPDYFTGNVAITAKVQNNGYAPAKNVRARVTLKGPDGSTWDTQTLYPRGDIAVDGTWDLSTSYTHQAGSSMPRGVPTVTVDLDYDKK